MANNMDAQIKGNLKHVQNTSCREFAAQEAGLEKNQIQQIFSSLPEAMKLEWNYSNWKYHRVS